LAGEEVLVKGLFGNKGKRRGRLREGKINCQEERALFST